MIRKKILMMIILITTISCSKSFNHAYQELTEPVHNQPTVSTVNLSNITSVSAVSGGIVPDDANAAEVLVRGVCWSVTPGPTVKDSCTQNGSGSGSYSSVLTRLLPNTTYYVRAYVTFKAGSNYGSSVSFITENSTNEMTDFKFLKSYNNNLSKDYIGLISGSVITIVLPYGTALDNLKASFGHTGSSVRIGAVNQASNVSVNNFSSPIIYSVMALDGSRKDYTVTVYPGYSVTYDRNGADAPLVNPTSFPVDANIYSQGSLVTVKGNSGLLDKTGYVFSGWSTQSDGGGLVYQYGNTFSMGSTSVVLYAKWVQKSALNLIYHANNPDATGSVPLTQNSFAGGTAIVSGNTGPLILLGYNFICWNTSADGKGLNYTTGDSIAFVSSDIHLYAVWVEKPKHTVYYDGNSNDGGTLPLEQTVYQGDSYQVNPASASLNKTGYTFMGWKMEGSETVYSNGASLVMGNSDVIFTAVWQVQ